VYIFIQSFCLIFTNPTKTIIRTSTQIRIYFPTWESQKQDGVSELMTDKIVLKVSGAEESVKRFLSKIQRDYGTTLLGRLLLNDRDDGVHCYVDIDLSSEVKVK